ncbi:MAG: hypothetical protein KKB31_07270 [Nanoarchaeota archaeon]|nr:hypothetical protein [Nanoarchaeota archaeon]
MAIEHVTFALAHNFAESGYRMVAGLPSLIPANVSMEVALTLMENETDALDCTGATCSMYGRPLESPVEEVALGTGVVSGGSNNVVTFTIPKNTIPEGWSLYAATRFRWVIENGAGVHLAEVFQEGIKIKSVNDNDSLIFPYSEDIAVSVYTISTPTTLTDKPGWRVILIDGTTVKLPDISASVYEQVLWVQGIGATGNILNPNGTTINNVAGNQTLVQFDGLILIQHGTEWIAINPSVTIP